MCVELDVFHFHPLFNLKSFHIFFAHRTSSDAPDDQLFLTFSKMLDLVDNFLYWPIHRYIATINAIIMAFTEASFLLQMNFPHLHLP